MNEWQWYALGSAFFAGLTAVLAKVGVAEISSNVATWIRAMVIVLILSVFLFVRREGIHPSALHSRSLIFLVLSAVAAGFSWLCYFRALQMGPASIVASIDKLSLVFTVLLAAFFLSEHPSGWQWGGVVLMSCGALLIVLK